MMVRPTARGSGSSSWQPPIRACAAFAFAAISARRRPCRPVSKRPAATCVMTLDADLQDDPARFRGSWPRSTKGSTASAAGSRFATIRGTRCCPSRVFNWLVGGLTGVKLHDHNCGIKCYRREIFSEVRLYGELHRFVPVLAAARGWKVGEIVVNHRPRKFGRSKYGVTRIVKGFLDLLTVYFLTGFEQRPQHLLGTCGIVAFGVGLVGLTYLSITWLLVNAFGWNESFPDWRFQPLHERPALFVFGGDAALGGAVHLDGFSGRAIHGLLRPGERAVFDQGARARRGQWPGVIGSTTGSVTRSCGEARSLTKLRLLRLSVDLRPAHCDFRGDDARPRGPRRFARSQKPNAVFERQRSQPLGDDSGAGR